MDIPPDEQTLILHAERTTISGDRYLIFYSFTTPDDEHDADAGREEE
jgi:hypothetical protein